MGALSSVPIQKQWVVLGDLVTAVSSW